MTQSADRPEMTAEDVCDFLALTDGHGIRIWLDGGWAVDACLGSQTRHQWLVRFHTGHEVDATDWADVSALCKRFGIPVPSEYSRFTDAR